MTSKNKVKDLGRVLGFWAHPDDESFLAGGLMSEAAKAGQAVMCVTATKGEVGESAIDIPKNSTLAEVREAELMDALKILGITEHQWLGYTDGQLEQADTEEGVAKLNKIVGQFQPDTIITFAPDGLTGHPDHKTVSKWVKLSGYKGRVIHAVHSQEDYDDHLKELDKTLNLYFMTDNPEVIAKRDCDLVFELSKDVLGCKIEALKAMPSQTLGLTSDEVLFKKMLPSLACEHYLEAN